MQEMQFCSLGREEPLEKGMATHSSILDRKSHGRRSLVGDNPWGRKEWTTSEWLNNWTCLVNEFWVEVTFPFRAGATDHQHERPESALLGHRTSSTHGSGCSSGVGGLIRAPRPSRVGIIWARINFGSFKMLRSVGSFNTEQPGACYTLKRAAGKNQDTQFSLDCRWVTHNLVGWVCPEWCTDHTWVKVFVDFM